MSTLLDRAVDTVRALPSPDQDAIARVMLALAGEDSETEPLDPAHLPSVLEGMAQAQRGEFATTAEVEAAFRRYDV